MNLMDRRLLNLARRHETNMKCIENSMSNKIRIFLRRFLRVPLDETRQLSIKPVVAELPRASVKKTSMVRLMRQ